MQPLPGPARVDVVATLEERWGGLFRAPMASDQHEPAAHQSDGTYRQPRVHLGTRVGLHRQSRRFRQYSPRERNPTP